MNYSETTVGSVFGIPVFSPDTTNTFTITSKSTTGVTNATDQGSISGLCYGN